MQPTEVQDISKKEVAFRLLRQGDKVSKNLFEYISAYYVVEHDEYEPWLLNVMSTDDEPEELMQLYPMWDNIYLVYYLE